MNVVEQIKNHSLYALAVLLISIIVGVWYLSEAIRVNPLNQTLNQRIEYWKDQVTPLKDQVAELRGQVAVLSKENKELKEQVAALSRKNEELTAQLRRPPDSPPPDSPPPGPDCKAIPSLNACIRALKFFESGRFGEKVYKERFEKESTKAVMAEITLQHPKPGHHINFEIRALLLNEPGKVVGRTQIRKSIEADSESSVYTFDVDNPTSTRGIIMGYSGLYFSVGSYRLDIYINDQKVTDGIFEVFSK